MSARYYLQAEMADGDELSVWPGGGCRTLALAIEAARSEQCSGHLAPGAPVEVWFGLPWAANAERIATVEPPCTSGSYRRFCRVRGGRGRP